MWARKLPRDREGPASRIPPWFRESGFRRLKFKCLKIKKHTWTYSWPKALLSLSNPLWPTSKERLRIFWKSSVREGKGKAWPFCLSVVPHFSLQLPHPQPGFSLNKLHGLALRLRQSILGAAKYYADLLTGSFSHRPTPSRTDL